jgi:hypothetical protein
MKKYFSNKAGEISLFVFNRSYPLGLIIYPNLKRNKVKFSGVIGIFNLFLKNNILDSKLPIELK